MEKVGKSFVEYTNQIKNIFSSKKSYQIIATLLLAIVTTFFASKSFTPSSGSDARVIYSLDARKNDQEIIRVIDNAKEYVYFAVYYFTEKNVAEALIRAKQRGLTVDGITDRDGAKNSANKTVINMLSSAGVSIETQKHLDGIMHMKLLVTDSQYASGSYNWTLAATESNDEVLEIGSTNSVREQYLDIIKKVIEKNRGEQVSDSSSAVIDETTSVARYTATVNTEVINFADAPKHIGEQAIVEGDVLKTFISKTGTGFLYFCKASTDCPFSVIIFKSDLSKLGKLSDYVGHIKVSGIIKTYKGESEIIVNDKSQLEK